MNYRVRVFSDGSKRAYSVESEGIVVSAEVRLNTDKSLDRELFRSLSQALRYVRGCAKPGDYLVIEAPSNKMIRWLGGDNPDKGCELEVDDSIQILEDIPCLYKLLQNRANCAKMFSKVNVAKRSDSPINYVDVSAIGVE